MSHAGRLEVIACQRGEKLDTLIPRLLEKHSHILYQVAVELGVYPNTIMYWLKKHNYHYENGHWVQRTEEVA